MTDDAVTSRSRISRATRDRLDDILRLLAIQLREHHVDIPDDHLRAAIQGVLDDPDRGFVLVQEMDGRCVGVAYVSFIWALEHGGHSAWLEEIFVEPELRAGGLGTQLLHAVLDECAANGCAAIDLEIDADHERVFSLYDRHGFASLPRRRLVRRLHTARPPRP